LFPQLVSADEGIEENDEFSHGGDAGDFGSLSVVSKASVEGFDGGVESDCAQGGHVEGASHAGAAAGYAALAAQRSAVVCDRGDPDQSGDFLVVDFAEFRQFGDEHSGGDLADAWHALQNHFAAGGCFVGPDRKRDRRIDAGELIFEVSDMLLDG
jgi:hypothetical protein